MSTAVFLQINENNVTANTAATNSAGVTQIRNPN